MRADYLKVFVTDEVNVIKRQRGFRPSEMTACSKNYRGQTGIKICA